MSELIKMQFVCAHELLIVTTRKRSCGKVMFLHLSVSHSVHRGVSASVHAGIQPPWEDTPLGTTPLGRHPPCRRLLQQTLRILLECILVGYFYALVYVRAHKHASVLNLMRTQCTYT